jgi:hypothetical protein
MAWSRGADLFSEIAEMIFDKVGDEDDRKAIYDEMIELFEDFDCDNLHECAGIDFILDEALIEAGIIEKDEEE